MSWNVRLAHFLQKCSSPHPDDSQDSELRAFVVPTPTLDHVHKLQETCPVTQARLNGASSRDQETDTLSCMPVSVSPDVGSCPSNGRTQKGRFTTSCF